MNLFSPKSDTQIPMSVTYIFIIYSVVPPSPPLPSRIVSPVWEMMMEPKKVAMGFLELWAKYSPWSTIIVPYSHTYCQLRNLIYLDQAIAGDMHVCSMISTSFKTRSGCPEDHRAYFDQVTAVVTVSEFVWAAML